MRTLTVNEMSLVSGGMRADPTTPREKPTDVKEGPGKAIGWCWGYGNLKDLDKHPIDVDGDCSCCEGPN